MLIVRLLKIVMTGGACGFRVDEAHLDNLIDYGSNYEFVKHVLSMDTTFPGNKLMGGDSMLLRRFGPSAMPASLRARG